MSKRTTPMAAVFTVGILTLVTVRAQQNAKGGMLSAMDYIQINQLINRYAYAVDTGADQGGMYAGLFAPDGKFLQRGGVVQAGREALASVGYRSSRGPQSVFHFLTSQVIEPTPDGNARGKEELGQFTIGDAGEPSKVFGGGHYDDIYERTKDGWRFKQRQFIPSQGGYELTIPTTDVPEQHKISTASVNSKTMTASDYIEIQQLVARYPYALDTGQRKGEMWVDLFTKDGMFGKAQGHDALLKIAWQHRPGQGPSYTRNFPQSVVITPTPEGATGKLLTYVIDVGEGGKPSPILNGAHYEDSYVRTPGGWRIKQRTVYNSKPGTAAVADLPALKVPGRVAKDAGNGAKHNGLAVEDYLDIEQLITTYPMALDTGAGEGSVYADLFASDGIFMSDTVKHQGRDDLKKFAWQHRPGQGPLYVRNYSTNPWIEASPEGATGKVYALVMDLGENGKPNSIIGGGHYEDVYVKTAQGWRIKKRQYIPSKTVLPPRQNAPAAAPASQGR